MSERYDVIEALMEDPLNLACVLHVLKRLGGSDARGVEATLVGPSRILDGILIFPTFLSLVEAQTARDADRVIEIFELGPGWYMNDVEKEEEYGPLESLEAAVEAAEELLLKKGITILSEVPWETP